MKSRSVFFAIPAKAGIPCVFVFLAAAAHADQYRSEVRELDTPPPPAQKQDAQKLLQQTTDPYARALLLRDLAAQAVQRKDYGAAAEYLEQAIGQKSLSGPALDQMRKDLTQLYVASGKPSEVIKALEPQVRNNPNASPEQLAGLAGAYLELKRYAEAVPLLQKAVAAVPRPEESWLQGLYAALAATGREKEGVPVLEKLVRVNPARREYWLQWIGADLKAGKRDEAIALLELAKRQGHLQGGDEYLQLVSLTAKAGAPFEAASLMGWLMDNERVPRSAADWEVLAGLWVDARETALAAGALTQALEQAPRAELYLQLGQLQMNREDYAAAAAALEKGLRSGARSGPALLALGSAYFQTAQVEAARRAFREAAGFAGSKAAASQWLAYLDTEEAAEQAQLAARRRARASPAPTQLSRRLEGGTVQAAALAAAPVTAAPTPLSADELRQVGGRLTPIGAERSANADGSIPAWEGGITRAQWPAAFKPGGRVVDPFPDDRPLFVITQANAAQYAARLTEGHKALLSKYPEYRMPVYATRRSASYPQKIYDATQANVGKARLIGSDAIGNARLGFPFPVPQNGVEVMWNHRVRYRGDSVQAQSTQAVVQPDGQVLNVLKQTERVFYRYANLKEPADLSRDNVLLYYLTWFSRGSSGVDFLALVHETANSMKDSRAIWVMPPSIRKMFRIPPVGYDQPFPGSADLQFIDMVDMYNGGFDRYVWKLTGKRELFIPYNSYRLQYGYTYPQLLRPHYPNPERARYELHRVWTIEATERGGQRHSFGRRTFYVDEDTWNVVLVENHDRQGALWRLQEGHLLPLYDTQSSNCLPVVTYDLKDGRYFINRLTAEDPPPRYDLPNVDKNEFLPANVKNRYGK
ncbi:MAG TPA: DUF1329 domain-containing protein [Candidatus Binatia bacterium]|nr:DUF1329 domain-containing protein [Candidatus Binatia bacterium]